LNLKYLDDVEKYLLEYRKYLENNYYSLIVKDRSKFIYIYANNLGLFPLNNLTIEIDIPKDLSLNDPEHTEIIKSALKESKGIQIPKEPDIFKNMFDFEVPNFSEYRMDSLGRESIVNVIENTFGPEIIERDGHILAIYKAKKIIQNLPERNFSPIFLWLGNIEESIDLEFKCKIFAEEIQRPITTSFIIDIKLVS
jgi:hypothetical protein